MLLVAVLVLVGGGVWAADDDAGRAGRVDALFAPWAGPETPGCAVAVIRDGKVVHQKGYGCANLDYGIPITPSTVFHVASVSKQFTAMAIQLLAADGKLSLDDDVRKYLPEVPSFGKTITLRHLIHHTSGLRDQWNLLLLAGWRLDDVITEDDIMSLVRRQKELNFEPGSEHLYCNTGYTLLGMVVRKVSGKPLAQFAKERIFEPLGMTRTHFHDDCGLVVKDRAYSYAPKGGGGFSYVPLSYSNVGATSLFTTVEDMARWDANFYDGRLGGQAVLREMLRRGRLNDGRTLDYASGLVHGTYRGLPTVSHDGGDAGYRTTITRFPRQRFSVAILSNNGGFDPGGMARKVADIYLADRLGPEPKRQVIPSVEVKVDPKLFELYVGDYQLFPGFILTFRARDGRFYVQATGQTEDELFAASETDFFLKVVAASVTFQKGPKGQATGLVLHQGGADMPAKRIERIVLRSKDLRKYLGTYYCDELDTLYTVSQEGEGLVLTYRRGSSPLQPTGKDLFGCSLGTVEFQRSGSGKVVALTMDNGRVKRLRFARVTLKR